MRILQINNYADPVGGAEVYARALTRELAKRGHVVGFFGTTPDQEVTEEHLRIVRRPRYDVRVLFRDALVRDALVEYVGRFHPDLIHLHNVFSLGVDVLDALGATGIPIVHTVHDFSLLCPNSWCVRGDGTPCSGGVGRQCFEHGCERNYPYDAEVALATLLKQRVLADVVTLGVAPSRHLARLMNEQGARDVRHLNYFIDPIAGTEPTQRESNRLVYIGRLEPEKGVEYLVGAMPAILAGAPGTRLTIVGGGSRADAITTRVRELGLAHAIDVLSSVPRAELGRFYATSTACVIPSIWSENSPLVAYECLSAGLPMIASRIGGIPELVEDGVAGWTFTPRDSLDLARQCLRLLATSAEERERMAARMRAIASRFDASPHLDALEELYRQALAPSAVPRGARNRIDVDFLTVVAKLGEEKGRLGAVFQEHVRHIQHLERELASRPSVIAPALEAVEADPGQALRRLARRILPSKPSPE